MAMKDHFSKESLYPYGLFPDGVPALYAPFGEYDEWMVQETFRYVSFDGWLVEVEKHFKTDLASVPKWLRVIWGVNRKEAIPAVIHDWGYRNNDIELLNVLTGETRTLTREEWDRMFYELMILSKTAPVRRYAFYHGVRVGGRFHKNWRSQ